jgi:hypothetical protein
MKIATYLVVPLGALMALTINASAACPLPNAVGEPSICVPPPDDPPPPPPEPNRLAGPDGNPIPNQNRCGDMQIPLADCPAYQDLAFFTDHCINGTEYNYSKAHSIAPLCSQISPTTYIGFCYCGCLERSTGIFVQDPKSGRNATERIDQITVGSVAVHALTDDATLSRVRYEPRGVEARTAGSEDKPLVVLHTADGALLAATELHAILLSTGAMIAAKDLEVGQSMVRQDGSFSTIASITRESTKDDVFNVLTNAGLNHKGHMIVANGLIVGDLMWQNTLAKDLNSIIVRQ